MSTSESGSDVDDGAGASGPPPASAAAAAVVVALTMEPGDPRSSATAPPAAPEAAKPNAETASSSPMAAQGTSAHARSSSSMATGAGPRYRSRTAQRMQESRAGVWLDTRARPWLVRAYLWPAPQATAIPVPATVLMGAFCGVIGSLVACGYHALLYVLVNLVWRIAYDAYREAVPESVPDWTYMFVATPGVGIVLAAAWKAFPESWASGLPQLATQLHLADPEIPWVWMPSMLVLSILTMLAAVPLGPEMPVVVLGAGMGSFLLIPFNFSGPVRRMIIFATTAGALSAFFGVPVAGAFFALELPHRFGLEYYESLPVSMVAALTSSMVSTAIFDLELVGHFPFPDASTGVPIDGLTLIWAVILGILGACIMYFFYQLTELLKTAVKKVGLKDRSVLRIAVGITGLLVLFLLVPPIMFWGDDEIYFLLTPINSTDALPNYQGNWQGFIPLPTEPSVSGTGIQLTGWGFLIVALFKLVAIAWSLAFQFRGGVIFPLINAGITFGRALDAMAMVPSASITIIAMSTAIAFVASVTKTPLGSALLLAGVASLSGPEITLNLDAVAVAAGYASVLASGGWTMYAPQRSRTLDRPDSPSSTTGAMSPRPSAGLGANIASIELLSLHRK